MPSIRKHFFFPIALLPRIPISVLPRIPLSSYLQSRIWLYNHTRKAYTSCRENRYTLPRIPMPLTLAEAQEIYNRHWKEQKQAGRRKYLDAWLNCQKDVLRIVVHASDDKDRATQIPYEYELGFMCEGLHQIQKKAAPRQTNMFTF